ncbi:3-hydroxybutyrate dehydrogenase [Skermanella aerolata]|jgi:3-hydroxybutyrate dehydrogenase|uniref:3-hydroxybutyrate dehydrogenase n=1 Tax=Skermanella aerolata TaxID=393310 RepID=A0A512DT15_9PROT|nr:3-hydroxybutyrate dehydrogenase [Skermanella aerolata]KJB95981.1 3-hydroxybutyrate dehydrogenase [Skermanella aerolata KACC 11604]GEO39586.1 3-hydroxybutyrate dehydrogenase [Skermanella aerolata]
MLKGKTALVTGSTSGIGLGIAEALAAKGADVMLNGFGEADAIAGLQKRIADQFGVKVGYDGADLSKPDQIKTLVEHATAELGKIDILVNNAGIQFTAPIEEFPPERWEAVIAINLSAVYYGMHYALPQMKQRGWGRIINIASAHGLVASVNKSAYVAAKHGVIGLSKVAALENAETGITSNCICPGWVLTPLVQKQIDALAERKGLSGEDAARELLGEKQPSKRFVTPEQLGELAVFLSSDAASNMTGSALTMDGGWTAQ